MTSIGIGKDLKLSPPFPRLQTGRATFTASSFPTNKLTYLLGLSTLGYLTVDLCMK